MDNWDNLRYYLEVARTGAVSTAAKQLQVSHATVLRRIDQLEQSLGVKLFKRLQSGYTLSDSGHALWPQALAIETQNLALERQFKGRDKQLSGSIRITQPENHIIDLYNLYAQFTQQYPNIKLEIFPSSTVKNLNRQEADVAIRFTDSPDELLVGRKIGRISFGTYASQTYLQHFKTPPSPADIDWVLWSSPTLKQHNDRQVNRLKRYCNSPKVIMRAESVSDIISAVRAGMGAGVISHVSAKNYPDLVCLEYQDLAPNPELWLLTHRDLREVARIKCFMRFMYEGLSLQVDKNETSNNAT